MQPLKLTLKGFRGIRDGLGQEEILRLEGEHPSLAGNKGFPVWDAPPRTAKRLGGAPGGTHRKKAQGP